MWLTTRILWIFSLTLSLILVTVGLLALPLTFQLKIFTFSVFLKNVCLLLAPIWLFLLVFSATVRVAFQATNCVLKLLGWVTVSNLLAVYIGYSVGLLATMAFGITLPVIEVNLSDLLLWEPLWIWMPEVNLSNSPQLGIFFGLILGVGSAMRQLERAKSQAAYCDRMANCLLIGFSCILPFIIWGYGLSYIHKLPLWLNLRPALPVIYLVAIFVIIGFIALLIWAGWGRYLVTLEADQRGFFAGLLPIHRLGDTLMIPYAAVMVVPTIGYDSCFFMGLSLMLIFLSETEASAVLLAVLTFLGTELDFYATDLITFAFVYTLLKPVTMLMNLTGNMALSQWLLKQR